MIEIKEGPFFHLLVKVVELICQDSLPTQFGVLIRARTRGTISTIQQ